MWTSCRFPKVEFLFTIYHPLTRRDVKNLGTRGVRERNTGTRRRGRYTIIANNNLPFVASGLKHHSCNRRGFLQGPPGSAQERFAPPAGGDGRGQGEELLQVQVFPFHTDRSSVMSVRSWRRDTRHIGTQTNPALSKHESNGTQENLKIPKSRNIEISKYRNLEISTENTNSNRCLIVKPNHNLYQFNCQRVLRNCIY